MTTVKARQPDQTIGGRSFHYAGFGEHAVDYRQAWEAQRQLHGQRVDDQIGDTVMLLEHQPVYTAGKRTQPQDRPVDGTPVVEVDRGGKITWHGPGQLVGYPVTKLPDHVYVVDYVRRLEEALIRACADLGLVTRRVAGRSGVWVPAGPLGGTEATTRQYVSDHSAVPERPLGGAGRERKIAALGVRVSRGVTMHGFALNCDCDLGAFDAIVPCGIADAEVTSLSRELGRDVSVHEAAPLVERHLADLLRWAPYDRS